MKTSTKVVWVVLGCMGAILVLVLGGGYWAVSQPEFKQAFKDSFLQEFGKTYRSAFMEGCEGEMNKAPTTDQKPKQYATDYCSCVMDSLEVEMVKTFEKTFDQEGVLASILSLDPEKMETFFESERGSTIIDGCLVAAGTAGSTEPSESLPTHH